MAVESEVQCCPCLHMEFKASGATWDPGPKQQKERGRGQEKEKETPVACTECWCEDKGPAGLRNHARCPRGRLAEDALSTVFHPALRASCVGQECPERGLWRSNNRKVPCSLCLLSSVFWELGLLKSPEGWTQEHFWVFLKFNLQK